MSKPPKTGPLILYVDDESGNRIVFEQSTTEFNVICAASGHEALELMSQHPVAVLVTDMRMPGMSGEELLRITKERYPQAIRMVITAYSDVEPILRAINEGLVVRYIVKPWQRTELVQVLRWACEAWTFGRDSAALQRRLMETERLATLGSIAALLVHDLKQPLMSLLVNIEVMRELAGLSSTLHAAVGKAAIQPAVRKRLLDLVDDLEPVTTDLKTSAAHLSELINGLREFGKPRDGASKVPRTDPLPIVRHAIAVCQELALTSRGSIGYLGPAKLPLVLISTTELTQVLINVIANGAQAVAARGTPNGKVSVNARLEEGMLEIRVQDDGIGMAADVLSRAGTPFFTTRAEGTGLGLAQCQRLIGTAGGRFKIESEPGKGTTVYVMLPLAA